MKNVKVYYYATRTSTKLLSPARKRQLSPPPPLQKNPLHATTYAPTASLLWDDHTVRDVVLAHHTQYATPSPHYSQRHSYPLSDLSSNPASTAVPTGT